MDTLLTFDEACERLRLRASTLYKLTASGEMTHVKTGQASGGRLLFREADLQEWIERHIITRGTAEVRRGRPRKTALRIVGGDARDPVGSRRAE